ncbi:hypothetical protein PHLCEN_2v13388 [Hermanssonia centrifuga]|uniref:RING-type domain-containing protein n=1 Tax=Hermanssonia centrifuga TaxID=98765 RepID=A0A2R6NEH0_9APHY|nr:hypothetical protein PHLCEN_2v13388 [Hermanssonia centrifuga]
MFLPSRSVQFHEIPWACFLSLALSLFFSSGAHGYIPASPTNATDGDAINGTAPSKLNLEWFGGKLSENISYQLVGADSTGISSGALVHFSEVDLSNDTTTTPWIALVSCDTNATNASQSDDIFTLARNRGAVAALLYSLLGARCQINPDYADPQNFDQAMDIYVTPSLFASQKIESEYAVLNATKYQDFNATLLNETAALVNITLANNVVTAPNYMFATLVAYNATGNTSASTGGTFSSPGQEENPGGPSSQKSSLAMIILYAITGCVSALFCVVIVSGAIRAIRHPERYGPRTGGVVFGPPGSNAFVPGQSRARGITRAILDTFPIVKFGRADGAIQQQAIAKDVESVGTESRSAKTESDLDVELRNMPALAMVSTDGDHSEDDSRKSGEKLRGIEEERIDGDPTSSSKPVQHVQLVPGPRPRRPVARVEASTSSTVSTGHEDLVPDAIGRETCPICIVDFEEGDDLRVLPCEGHHRFHQQCVDQWLLELSASCPICRQDFHALEAMMSHDAPGDRLEPPPALGGARPLSNAGARLSRYLRLARRRRRDREYGYDPTNPPMPQAPETTV